MGNNMSCEFVVRWVKVVSLIGVWQKSAFYPSATLQSTHPFWYGRNNAVYMACEVVMRGLRVVSLVVVWQR